MADLSSAYLGLALKNPLVPSSSPLTGDLDSARRLEDAGAAAIVLPSLFEETILAEEEQMARFLDDQSIGHGEADSFRPVPARFQGAEETYLNRLRQLKEALAIPVIASLNGATDGGWLSHAAALAEAGADALELNIYYLAGDPLDTAASVEARYLAIARSLVASMDLPVAVKLSSQFTAPLDLVQGLEREGVQGVSLFNRFYQPDIDLETLAVVPRLALSTAEEALLRVRWTAMLRGHTRCGIAVTGGFHSVDDALKALLAGADVVHLCSLLLREGPPALAAMVAALGRWLEEHEYESVAQLKGSLSCEHAPDPAAYARANYLQVLENYRVPAGVRY